MLTLLACSETDRHTEHIQTIVKFQDRINSFFARRCSGGRRSLRKFSWTSLLFMTAAL